MTVVSLEKSDEPSFEWYSPPNPIGYQLPQCNQNRPPPIDDAHMVMTQYGMKHLGGNHLLIHHQGIRASVEQRSVYKTWPKIRKFDVEFSRIGQLFK